MIMKNPHIPPTPKLREVSQPVKKFGPEIKKLSEDMIETMYHAHGIGLAAPQKWASWYAWW